jgi:hypothetical protein
MRNETEEDPMIEDLVLPADPASGSLDRRLDDPVAFFRGLLVALAVSVPIWSAMVWVVAKIN